MKIYGLFSLFSIYFLLYSGEDCEQKSLISDQIRVSEDGGKHEGANAAFPESQYVVAIDHVSLVRVGRPRGSLVEVRSTKVRT